MQVSGASIGAFSRLTACSRVGVTPALFFFLRACVDHYPPREAMARVGLQVTPYDFGIMYIDDILLNFMSWPDAAFLLEDLSQHLRKYGLSISWVKSTIMSVQHILDVGSAAVPQDAIIRSCAWSTSLRYLKRKLVHPDNVIDVTTQLLSQTSATMHAGFGDLVGVAKMQHWTRPRHAVQFAGK